VQWWRPCHHGAYSLVETKISAQKLWDECMIIVLISYEQENYGVRKYKRLSFLSLCLCEGVINILDLKIQSWSGEERGQVPQAGGRSWCVMKRSVQCIFPGWGCGVGRD
jgi:hypothetical protein